MNAADVMHRGVLTVRESLTVRELSEFLLQNGISGAPVVDAGGRLMGVVSQTDIVRFEREEPGVSFVRDVMTPAVLAADIATPVRELARRMTQEHVHRLVITERGKLAGIVSSLDLLRVLLLPR